MKWIRLWTEETVFGSTFKELNAEERGVWFSLLALAGIGAPPPGEIKVCDKWGYTDHQLAAMLKVDKDLTRKVLNRLVKVEKITISKENIIYINNWKRYQTEYERQKKYRGLQPKVTGKGYKEKLQTEGEGEKR